MPFKATYHANPLLTADGVGTTQATARRHFSPMIHFFDRHPEQTLYLADDCFHDLPSPGADIPGFGAKAHLTVRSYGYGAKPVVDLRNWITPQNKVLHGLQLATPVQIGFVYEGPATDGGHIWSLNMANNPALGTSGNTPTPVFRVWAGARNNGKLLHQRTIGEALRRIPDQDGTGNAIPLATVNTRAHVMANVKETCPWFGGDGTLDYKLYMWTNSQFIDPAAYYEGLACTMQGKGTMGSNGFALGGAQDVEINGIDVIGPRSNAFDIYTLDLVSGNTMPSAGIRVINCDTLCTLTGYNLRSQTSMAGIAAGAPYGIQDVLILNCRGNSNSSEKEQEPNKTHYRRLSGASDMFQMRGNMINCRFENVESIDSFHTGLTLGGFDAITAKPASCGAHNLTVRSSEWNAYARGFGIYMCQDSCFIHGVTLDGTNVHSQVVGGPLITNWVGKNARPNIRNADDTEGWLNVWTIVSKGANGDDLGLGNNAYFLFEPTNLRIVNASLGPCYGTPIKFQSYGDNTSGGVIPGTAAIREGTVKLVNVVIDDSRPERANLPAVKMEKYGAAPEVAVIPFTGVAVHKFGEVMPKVDRHTVIQDINVSPGFSNVITADPKLDANMRPKAGSPLRGAGVATSLVDARDAAGRRFKSTPSIGAFEVG